MTKKQQLVVINKMKETIGFIRDAEKNEDYFFPAEKIKSNMGNYFTGLAFALEAATDNEYHWSNNENGWALVIQSQGKEDEYQYI